MKNFYDRQSVRLKGYDYSLPGVYFVTIDTKNYESYFGEVEKGKVKLSEMGKIANQFWRKIPAHYPSVQLDEFIVMPNHLHGVLLLDLDFDPDTHAVWAQNFAPIRAREHYNKFGPQPMNLASIIRGFKMAVRKYAVMHNLEFFWHRGFYDRIVRNQDELDRITVYIRNNPDNWPGDRNSSA